MVIPARFSEELWKQNVYTYDTNFHLTGQLLRILLRLISHAITNWITNLAVTFFHVTPKLQTLFPNRVCQDAKCLSRSFVKSSQLTNVSLRRWETIDWNTRAKILWVNPFEALNELKEWPIGHLYSISEKNPFHNLVRFVFLETPEVLGVRGWQNGPHYPRHPFPLRTWAVFGKCSPLKFSLRFTQKERVQNNSRNDWEKSVVQEHWLLWIALPAPRQNFFLFSFASWEHDLVPWTLSDSGLNFIPKKKRISRKCGFCNVSKITTCPLKLQGYGKWGLQVFFRQRFRLSLTWHISKPLLFLLSSLMW